MRYLLDTNVCIRYLNGRSPKIIQRLHELQPTDVVICAITRAELFYGAHKSQNPLRTLSRQQKFVEVFQTLPFDDRAAETYGKIRAALSKAGTPIGPNDLMIASIAVIHNLVLVTHNVKEFSRVQNLHIEDWE